MADASECAAQVALPLRNVWLLDTPLLTNLFTKSCLPELTNPGAFSDFSFWRPFRKKALACQQSVLLIFLFNFIYSPPSAYCLLFATMRAFRPRVLTKVTVGFFSPHIRTLGIQADKYFLPLVTSSCCSGRDAE